MTTKADNKMEYSKIGDITHALTIGSTVAFAYAVAKFARPGSVIFDPVWIQDGFCVANKDVPYWNSHDMCFYFDTVMAVVTAVLYFALKDSPGMDSANLLVKTNCLGIFGHGLGHGAISKAIRDGQEPGEFPDLSEMGLVDLVTTMAPFVIFWLCLLKAAMPNVSNSIIALATVPTIALNFLIAPQFGFTYVQTVLMLAFSFNQLARPVGEKDFTYALFPVLVGFPLGLIGWLESTCCSKFVVDIGGHIIYDAYIPISIIVVYLYCWHRGSEEKPKKA